MNVEIFKWIVDSGLVVLIWMVQLLIYPGFEFMDARTFHKWHKRYARNITFIVAPLMIAQTIIAIFLLLNDGTVIYSWIYALLVASTWITTFLIFIPIHHKLDTIDHSVALCKKLTSLNWIRVLLWSVILILDLLLAYSWQI